jgi:glycolate oxidase iron-sulfur subunit
VSPAFDATRPPPLELIEDCVHCGFCLPTCPTYSLWDEEMDSPRGRIVLMKGGLEEDGELSAPMVQALDNCLGCMACVTACPSGVQYDKLIEDTRAQVERNWDRPLRERLLRRAIFALAPHPGRLRALAPLLPLARIARRLPGGAGAAAALAPRVRVRAALRQLPDRFEARGEKRGTVALLQGCVQRAFFGDVNAATVRVLVAEGWEVHAPRSPRCCGALMLHTGVEDEARELALATIAAYERYDHVVVNAAGCGSAMKEYEKLLAGDPEWADRATAVSAKTRDLAEYLEELGPRAVRHPLPVTVAYHDACHLAHAQGIRAQPRALLRGIPGLAVREIMEADVCCGSAGIYNILQPEAARELGDRKAAGVTATGAELLVAANPGCTMQIATAMSARGEHVAIAHTAEVLDASLRGVDRETFLARR